jgi:hypothetical protein
MAFSFNINQTPANWVGCMMQLWQTMVNAGWLILSWSDGSTAHGSPGAGFLGFTTSSLGIPNSAGGAGSANNSLAWVLLQQPTYVSGSTIAPPYGGVRQFTFQLSSGANRQNWRIKYSMSGGYTAPGTAGTATVTPGINATVNDELIHMGGGTDAAPTFGTMFSNNGNYEAITRCHCIADDGKGPSGSQPSVPYGFIMWGPVQGLNTSGMPVNSPMNFVLMFDPMEQGSAAPQDLDPFCAYADAGGYPFETNLGGNTFWPSDTAGGGGFGFSIRGWMRRGQTNQTYTAWQALVPYCSNAGVMVNNFGSNHITGNDDLCPVIYARNSVDGGLTGYKGISSFVRWNGTFRQTSDTLSFSPTGSSRDRIITGQCNIPWDGSTVPLI